MSEQISLEQAYRDATSMAKGVIEFAGGMGQIKALLEDLGLNPDGGQSEWNKALDIFVGRYLNDFVESGLIVAPSLARH